MSKPDLDPPTMSRRNATQACFTFRNALRMENHMALAPDIAKATARELT